MSPRIRSTSIASGALLLATLAGCTVGPNYKTPAAITAPAFKEAGPAASSADGWNPGQPGDAQLKGDWWNMFGDAALNTLEAQVDGANQTIKAAEANFRAARAQVGVAKSYRVPAIAVGPSIGAIRDSGNQPYFNNALANDGGGEFNLAVDLNYEVDLWGRIRRGITYARQQSQAVDADLENARLSLHAELALDYVGLRVADAQIRLLDDTVKAYENALQLTKDRFDGGVAPQSDVSQAQTQLDQANVQKTDLEVERSQYEHAIAVLIGKPPALFSLASAQIETTPQLPQIPGMMPTALLQRRPDIAGYERRMASANEQIGIAQAAFYPTLSISASGGFLGTSAANWFTWPSRFWAVGPQVSETVIDGGRRKATKTMTVAEYDMTVANYRQTVLTAFQQVEDNLTALSVLSREAQQQQQATASAKQSLDLFQTRYEGGVDTYLQVVTWQTAALNNQRNELNILERRLDASVLLIKALGGGWDTSKLPVS